MARRLLAAVWAAVLAAGLVSPRPARTQQQEGSLVASAGVLRSRDCFLSSSFFQPFFSKRALYGQRATDFCLRLGSLGSCHLMCAHCTLHTANCDNCDKDKTARGKDPMQGVAGQPSKSQGKHAGPAGS
ncbi:hypothetical protein BT67DRAFT_439171 [Trichocladium antarcticum]|uniref:Uncharacterized protein n=1 Tax=Trichocladium antarcticum TaxID=1450529 RepID=A0AAN6USP2_9PEZI|nr:hypothetical protein BT67DRAFT_439171 [Trichocladium antarcticum]